MYVEVVLTSCLLIFFRTFFARVLFLHFLHARGFPFPWSLIRLRLAQEKLGSLEQCTGTMDTASKRPRWYSFSVFGWVQRKYFTLWMLWILKNSRQPRRELWAIWFSIQSRHGCLLETKTVEGFEYLMQLGQMCTLRPNLTFLFFSRFLKNLVPNSKLDCLFGLKGKWIVGVQNSIPAKAISTKLAQSHGLSEIRSKYDTLTLERHLPRTTIWIFHPVWLW